VRKTFRLVLFAFGRAPLAVGFAPALIGHDLLLRLCVVWFLPLLEVHG
jgi:hypothetical protein